MADIFISYKREDQEEHGRVAPIAEALRAEGYDVFYDVQVPPGSSWEAVLQSKMDQARCVLVLWSRASIGSDWVKEEAEMAKADGKLIPVFLDAVAPPFGFARIEGANLAGWDGDLDHIEWRGLVAAVKARIGTGEGAAEPAVTRVAYAPSKSVTVEKRRSGGGAGRFLGVSLAVVAAAAAGFFGWQAWQSNEMLRDQAEDAAFDTVMTREADLRDFQAAEREDTVAAYQRYLTIRPDGRHRVEALDRIEELQAAARAPTPAPALPPPPATAPRPDLVFTDLTPEADSVAPGEALRVRSAIANRGDALAAGSNAGGYMVDFVLSRDDTAPVRFASYNDTWSEDTLLRGGRASGMPPLEGRAAHYWSEPMEIPEGWPEGRFRLCGVIVPGRAVDEARTDNNVRCAELFVARPPQQARPAVPEPSFDYGALQRRTYSVGPVRIARLNLTPAPPARVREGERITINFAYEFSPGRSANVWMRPVISGAPGPCSYGASGSPTLSGAGTGTQHFTLRGGGCAGGQITGVTIRVGDRERTDDTVFPVAYTLR